MLQNAAAFQKTLASACCVLLLALPAASSAEEADWEQRLYSAIRDLPRGEDVKVFLEKSYGQQLPKGTEILVNHQAGAFYVHSDPAFLHWLDKRYGDPYSQPYNAFVTLRRYRVSEEEIAAFLNDARASSTVGKIPKRKAEILFASTTKFGHKFPVQIGAGADNDHLEIEINASLEVALADCSVEILSDEVQTTGEAPHVTARFHPTVAVGKEEFVWLHSEEPHYFLYTIEVMWESRVREKKK